MKKLFANIDIPLMAILLLLSLFGLVMVYSASFAFSILEYGSGTYFFLRQAIWLLLGFTVFCFVSLIPYQIYGKWVPFLTMITVALLLIVIIPGLGIERNYSTRWIGVGPLTFQPSELAKIVMILFFAKAYTNKQDQIEDFRRGLFPPIVMLIIVSGLILLQPDLGTLISIAMACASILLISGGRIKHIVSLATVVGIAFIGFAFSADYRMKRITSFFNPFDKADSDGFQLVNSYVAIGDGGLFGHGLGNSIQKLGYLPEAHTDFIMAIIFEELGLFGLLIILGLFLLLLFKGFSIYRHAPNRFGQLLAFGITAQITVQAIMNLSAVAGLLPITGIPLPLISYGGTSLLVTFASLGILMNISRQISVQDATKSESIDLKKRPQIHLNR